MILIAVLGVMTLMIQGVESAGISLSLSTYISTVRQTIVDTHNSYRRNANPTAQNMLKMMWNEDTAQNAGNWSATCSFTHSTSNQRTIPGFNCGENIYMATYPASWEEAIQAWYSEGEFFNMEWDPLLPGKDPQGHYTQLMWYNSYMVGCAVSYCPANYYQYLYVCQYCTAGNNVNTITTPYKSGPTCGDCPGACDNGLCTNYCPYQDLYTGCSNFIAYCNIIPMIMDGCRGTCLCRNNQII
ncbi:cysteine-rich secretory protein 1 gene 5 S homeolog precursor [Xenopus laevis]|uniref:Cysteine rich secretory protein n=1 Tax=Xenopus laevis TaxID=8355 RepID=Q801Z0_XENLA|nr:cysteine-rich secretory protein 1 gene 5 S homeolog precursor [Xenopus laevis]AAO84055.1 cysteine rich secretory protein [Xenopus laevis]